MIETTTKKGKAAVAIAALGVLGAVVGAAANGWVSMQEIEERENRDAYQRAQLEKVWETVRDDARRRDEDLVRLREAVAEMKGALEQMHRGRMEHAFRRGGALETLLEERKGKLDKSKALPAQMPAPDPKRVREVRQAAE